LARRGEKLFVNIENPQRIRPGFFPAGIQTPQTVKKEKKF
jgi:hypothetical protein